MAEKESAHIQELDLSAFSIEDISKLILQRSEIIRDQRRPGQIVKAWTEGDMGPLSSVVDTLGEELVHRAAAIISLEYAEIAPAIARIAPRRVADIGCGYALFDYFLWRDQQASLILIDLEETKERHFGFKPMGAAYSSLSVAKRFLTDNGVPEDQVHCVNPQQSDVMSIEAVDLATSFISCGFHYPVQTYDTFFQNSIREGGGIILDIRKAKLSGERPFLDTLGQVTTLVDAAYGNAARMLVQK